MFIKIPGIQAVPCPEASAVLADPGLGGGWMWVKEPNGGRNKVEQFAS